MHDNLVAQSSELINYGAAALSGLQGFKAGELTEEGHVYFLQVLGPLADEEHFWSQMNKNNCILEFKIKRIKKLQVNKI